MTAKIIRLDSAFLDKQQHRLTELRKEILALRETQESDRANANADANGQAREYEDDAQALTSLELQGNITAVEDERLSNIERALQKIADGTYGLSDGSGAHIPIERLEAFPEALYTLEEQASRDAAR